MWTNRQKVAQTRLDESETQPEAGTKLKISEPTCLVDYKTEPT